MKLARYSFILVAVLSVLTISSCKKSKLNKQTTTAEDNALAEDSFDDVFKNINEAAEDQKLDGTAKLGFSQDYTFGSCATVTLNPLAWDSTGVWNPTFPKTLTIDFGAGCTGADKKVRKGKIISVFSGKHNETGTVITTTLDDYYVDDYKVEGTKKVTNTGTNSFSIEVTGKIIAPNDDEVSWESTRARIWIEGQNTGFWTPNPSGTGFMGFDGILDDVYSITGSASGTNRNGRDFEATITTAFRVQFCGLIPEITQGVIEIEPDDLKKRTVDFGDQECDRAFTVSIGKKTYTKTY